MKQFLFTSLPAAASAAAIEATAADASIHAGGPVMSDHHEKFAAEAAKLAASLPDHPEAGALHAVEDKMMSNDLKLAKAEQEATDQQHNLGDLMESVNLLMNNLKPEEHGGQLAHPDHKAEATRKIKEELKKRRTRKRMPTTLTRLEEILPKMDKNGDGKLSFDEMLEYTRAQRKVTYSPAMAEGWDKNGDGVLSKLEMLEGKLGLGKPSNVKTDQVRQLLDRQRQVETKKFDASDKNKDGVLDKEELKLFMDPALDEDVQNSELKSLLSFRDEHKDGKLELWEWMSPAPRIMDIQYDVHDKEKEIFKIHDKNKDDFLDFDELREFSYGETKLLHELKSLIEAVDKDRDGHIATNEILHEENDRNLNRTITLNHAVDEWAFHDHMHKEARGEEL